MSLTNMLDHAQQKTENYKRKYEMQQETSHYWFEQATATRLALRKMEADIEAVVARRAMDEVQKIVEACSAMEQKVPVSVPPEVDEAAQKVLPFLTNTQDEPNIPA